MRYYAQVGDRAYECTLEAGDGALFVSIAGVRYRVDLQPVPHAHVYSLLLDGRSYEFTVHENGDALELSGGAGLFHVEVEDARTHAARAKTAPARATTGPRRVRAVMPGIVREVLVAEGQAVAQGEPLLILEAMKMQNEIRAPDAGKVERLHVAPGDTVEKGADLIAIR